jgi:EpsG family
MWPYWSLFLVIAYLAVTHHRPILVNGLEGRWSASWRVLFIVLVLMIGFRYEVGVDWGNYLGHIEQAAEDDFLVAIQSGDPAYSAMNWLGSRYGDVYLPNMIAAALFSAGLIVFSRCQPFPWLAVTVAVPYLVIAVAMGYNRQGLALGFVMLGLATWQKGHAVRLVFWITLAALCHKSAIILLPLVALGSVKRKFLTFLSIALIGVSFYLLFLLETVEAWNETYIQAEYQSSGGLVRVIMNAFPAGLFLLFRKKFKLSETQLKFWTWMAFGAIGLLIILPFSPSSTAVDRIALYWIPLQIFVLARLPSVLKIYCGSTSFWVAIITLYCTLVLFVWIFFADFSWAWIPYQFYPWVWLWQ